MRIAVIGSGVAGLGAAYLLSPGHDVELFEKDTRAGGHVHTVEHRGIGLDTGFIVHNTPNYPYLGRLFGNLGVAVQESEMSFSVACGGCGLEWSGRRPFAQARNVASPRFHRFLLEVRRWLRTARATMDTSEGLSLGQYVERHGYSERFRSHFLVPLTSALWSTAPERALDFPAAYAIGFFENHGMLGFGRFPWRTVSGGSRRYVEALLERLPGRAHIGLGVRALRRTADGVELTTADGETRLFDRLSSPPTPTRRSACSPTLAAERRADARYTANETVLHTDSAPPPRGPRLLNYQVNGAPADRHLPPELPPAPEATSTSRHAQPQQRDRPRARSCARSTTTRSTPRHAAGQREVAALNGARHTLYAGAHPGTGSTRTVSPAVRAAALLGVEGASLYTGTLIHPRRTPARNTSATRFLLRPRPRRAAPR
jgi:predicted NAD/FAD-binding protein